MDASAIALKLVGWNVVTLHVLRGGVTAGTCPRDLQRMYGRQCVGNLTDIMYAVTIDTSGDSNIASREPFSVDARFVLCKLIYPLLRLELMN